MKKPVIVLIVILVIGLALSFSKDIIVKALVEKGVEVVTGLCMDMQGLRVGIINTLVKINGLRLFNPRGYKDKIMLDMPEIYVDYNLPAIIKGKIHLEEIRINLREFTVVKNEQGKLNLDFLKVVRAQKEGRKPQAKEAAAGEKSKAPEIQIDSLELKIGRVVYKDYSGAVPSTREFKINLDQKYENITNPYALVSLIVVKALANTTIAGLADFDLQGLEQTISGTLQTAQKAATGVVGKTQEVTGQTVEAVKKTAGELTEMLKLPFGSKEE